MVVAEGFGTNWTVDPTSLWSFVQSFSTLPQTSTTIVSFCDALGITSTQHNDSYRCNDTWFV